MGLLDKIEDKLSGGSKKDAAPTAANDTTASQQGAGYGSVDNRRGSTVPVGLDTPPQATSTHVGGDEGRLHQGLHSGVAQNAQVLPEFRDTTGEQLRRGSRDRYIDPHNADRAKEAHSTGGYGHSPLAQTAGQDSHTGRHAVEAGATGLAAGGVAHHEHEKHGHHGLFHHNDKTANTTSQQGATYGSQPTSTEYAQQGSGYGSQVPSSGIASQQTTGSHTGRHAAEAGAAGLAAGGIAHHEHEKHHGHHGQQDSTYGSQPTGTGYAQQGSGYDSQAPTSGLGSQQGTGYNTAPMTGGHAGRDAAAIGATGAAAGGIAHHEHNKHHGHHHHDNTTSQQDSGYSSGLASSQGNSYSGQPTSAGYTSGQSSDYASQPSTTSHTGRHAAEAAGAGVLAGGAGYEAHKHGLGHHHDATSGNTTQQGTGYNTSQQTGTGYSGQQGTGYNTSQQGTGYSGQQTSGAGYGSQPSTGAQSSQPTYGSSTLPMHNRDMNNQTTGAQSGHSGLGTAAGAGVAGAALGAAAGHSGSGSQAQQSGTGLVPNLENPSAIPTAGGEKVGSNVASPEYQSSGTTGAGAAGSSYGAGSGSTSAYGQPSTTGSSTTGPGAGSSSYGTDQRGLQSQSGTASGYGSNTSGPTGTSTGYGSNTSGPTGTSTGSNTLGSGAAGSATSSSGAGGVANSIEQKLAEAYEAGYRAALAKTQK